MSIETVIHKVATDPEFARAMKEDPLAALELHGVEIAPEELDALQSALRANYANLAVDQTEDATDWYAPQFKGATADPTDWYAPQFKGASADPTDWYEDQFHTEVA